MNKPAKYLSIFFLSVNALAAASLLYKWSGEAIHEWHMSYYEDKGYPLEATRTEIWTVDKNGMRLRPVFQHYS
jgi:hypothetical protein